MVDLSRDDLDRLTAGAPGPDRVVELLADVFVAVDPDELVPVAGEEPEVA